MGVIETLRKPISGIQAGIQEYFETNRQKVALKSDLEQAVLRRDLGDDGNTRVINRCVQVIEGNEYPLVRLGDIAVEILDHLLYIKVRQELSLEDLSARFQRDGKLPPVLEVLTGHLGLSLRAGTLPEGWSFKRDIGWAGVLGGQLEYMKSRGEL